MSFAVLQEQNQVVHYFYPKNYTVCIGSDPIRCELVIPYLLPLQAKIFIFPLPLDFFNSLPSVDTNSNTSDDTLDILSISSLLEEEQEQFAMVLQNCSRQPLKVNSNKFLTMGQFTLLHHNDTMELQNNSICKLFKLSYHHDAPLWTTPQKEKIVAYWKSLHQKHGPPKEMLNFTLVHRLLLQDILHSITNGLSTNPIETSEELIDALQDVKNFIFRKSANV